MKLILNIIQEFVRRSANVLRLCPLLKDCYWKRRLALIRRWSKSILDHLTLVNLLCCVRMTKAKSKSRCNDYSLSYFIHSIKILWKQLTLDKEVISICELCTITQTNKYYIEIKHFFRSLCAEGQMHHVCVYFQKVFIRRDDWPWVKGDQNPSWAVWHCWVC